MTPAPARVLVVEDSVDDERLTLRALRRGRLPLDVRVARDGHEAEAALGLDAAAPEYEPDLVLLSLEEGCDDDHSVLASARRAPRLSAVPIVVLSSVVEDGAEARCLAAGATAHAVKPIDVDAYTVMVGEVVERWLARGDARP